MPESEIVNFIAICRARPDKVAELQAAFEEAVAPTRQEAGCLGYILHQNRENPAEFVFYETWADQAALDRHFGSAHNLRLIEKITDLLAEPPTLISLRQIA